MVNLGLDGVTTSIATGFNIFINFLENLIAPFIIIFFILLFFALQVLLIWLYFKLFQWIMNVAVPFFLKFGIVVDSFQKFREFTSTGLFKEDEKKKSSNSD